MKSVLGIIGAGQLALYLCEAARGLGLETAVLADSDDAPALQRADRPFPVVDTGSGARFDAFLSGCDVVTFDKEAIGDALLSHLTAASRQRELAVRPGVDILYLLQDKARQKTWLREHGLPTLPFAILDARPAALAPLTGTLGDALVQKSRRGGYDGRGVQVLQALESPEQLWDTPSIVEPFLANCREISVVTARALSGELQTYPPVGMEFDTRLNVVRTVFMPAAIGPALSAAAVALAERVVTLLQGVGVFAVEMFVTPADELLINEVSPRVHNSGHLTQDACNASQFEQHVRAVMGLPLATIAQTRPAAMCNILYTHAIRERCPGAPLTEKLPGVPGATVYWYGKSTGSIGRKMGHANAVASDVGQAIATAQRALAEISGDQREHVA